MHGRCISGCWIRMGKNEYVFKSVILFAVATLPFVSCVLCRDKKHKCLEGTCCKKDGVWECCLVYDTPYCDTYCDDTGTAAEEVVKEQGLTIAVKIAIITGALLFTGMILLFVKLYRDSTKNQQSNINAVSNRNGPLTLHDMGRDNELILTE